MTAAPDPRDPATRTRRGRRTLLLLAALFFVPLALAFALYYGGSGWRPGGSTNRGDLLEPARPLPELALPTADGARTDPGFLRGKWSWVYVGDGRCDARCREALYLTRQSRIALNKDMDRVQRVFLATGGCCDLGFFNAEHPDLLLVRVDAARGAELLALLPSYGGLDARSAGRVYLVDPLGNLLLSYATDAPDKALLQDLSRLLRLSHIG
jgi:cytochrome oxidase Cu insertion factor (SCO1/SenC/PrrC family)